MLHEALMLEIYRQALNAGALPNPRPRSTESANSSERCPSHDSNSSEVGGSGIVPTSPNASTFPAVPHSIQNQHLQQHHQQMQQQPPSMEAYLHMVAAAAQQYGFPLGAANVGSSVRLPVSLPTSEAAHFKLPPQASPNASSNNSEALDFRTHLFGRGESAEPPASEADEEEEDDEEQADGNNPLDLSVGGTRKRIAEIERDSPVQNQTKKIFKEASPPIQPPPATVSATPLMPTVNPYLAAVAAANIFRTGQFPDWNGKSDLVVDPLEKMSDIVKGPRKEKTMRSIAAPPTAVPAANTIPSSDGMSKARHNIWQSHWQNKGVASSVFRCVWCKQSFSTLEALTTHMKDSKHCGVNVPPFGNLPNTDRHQQHQQQSPHHHHQQQQQHQHQPHQQQQHSHNMRKPSSSSQQTSSSSSASAAGKNSYSYSGRDPPTPLPRKLVRGQNVWLGKGVEQAMQILKCMRCGESFRSLGEMTKHMQETQHYTNILSQEQTISMKSSAESKDGTGSMSSEESRTLSAVLTCKVCDKAFSSLGDLSNHMAKNNHYSEPLMQSMTGGHGGGRKRPAPKKREKSLPVRKLLEMKGAHQGSELDSMDMKLQRTYESSKRMSMEGSSGVGGGSGSLNEKMEAAMFAERMRQYISGVKSADEAVAANKSAASNAALLKKLPELETKNGGTKQGSSSVLSAIEQMFTTSFDTPPRHTNVPAQSPSNMANKNTSPVASSILKRLGIDETVDYNKPLIDTQDAYYHHYRYTSSERSGSECSVDNHQEIRKLDAPPSEKSQQETPLGATKGLSVQAAKNEDRAHRNDPAANATLVLHDQPIKREIKSENEEEQQVTASVSCKAAYDRNDSETILSTSNGELMNLSMTNSNNNNNDRSTTSPKLNNQPLATQPSPQSYAPKSPESHRSGTPKSPASSIKSFDGEKKYPSDSLNALSSMFDSLGSGTGGGSNRTSVQSATTCVVGGNGESPENLPTSNSLAALRQFCVKKEKTA